MFVVFHVLHFWGECIDFLGLPGWCSGKESSCQYRRCRRHEFSLWVGRSPGVGNGNPLQYSCSGKFNGQRSLAGYSLWGWKELDTTEHTHRRRQWHPTPVLLLGKSHRWRSLVGCSPGGREESDITERLHFHFSLSCIGEGNGNLLQYFCLENPRDRGAWWAAVYGVEQSQTQLKRLSSSRYYYWFTNHCLFCCILFKGLWSWNGP